MRSTQRDATSTRGPVPAAGETGADRLRPARPRAALPRLQRVYGNRRTREVVQAKLNVGPADDRFEREADLVAAQAMGPTGAAGPRVRRAPEAIQRVPGAAGGVADAAVGQAVERARGGGGRPVPGRVRERMERATGADLGGVRVHVDAESDRLNDALGSRAFTVGADVFVRRGEYRPGSARGDALLGHELTHTIQQGAASMPSSPLGTTPIAPTTPVAQRDFGFELELGIPVFSQRDGAEGYPVAPAGVKEIATDPHKSFDVHIDHDRRLNSVVPTTIRGSTTPIIELVTRKMNELTVAERQVRLVMQRLVSVAQRIETARADNASVPLDDLPGLVANPAGVNFVGYPVADPANSPLTVDASVQATYGMSLKRVGAEFDARAAQATNTAQPPGSIRDSFELSKAAMRKAREIADEMVVLVRSMAQDSSTGEADELGELHGLFALIANYLCIGKRTINSRLGKNALGIFFYKTALSTVRNNITRKHPKLGDLLDDEDNLEVLSGELLRRAARKPKNPVLPGSEVICGEWVMDVLAGKGDEMFDTYANRMTDPDSGDEYVVELAAEDVGRGFARGSGVVLENRRFAETNMQAYLHRYPPTQWADLAVDLYRYLRTRHDAGPS